MDYTSKYLITFFVVFLATNFSHQQLLVRGWAIGPARYVFNIENALANGVLNVHCKSDHDDLGLVRLPIHNNYTHGFKTELFKSVQFYCELTIPGRAFLLFDAFKDVIEFVDRQCGGRHCFWKAMDGGVYLYHIQKRQYFKKYDWNTFPTNEAQAKKINTDDLGGL